MSDAKVDAVVLAGGDGAIVDPSCRFKGLAVVAGKPMVEWVSEALRASPCVAEVAVVAPTAEDLGPWADRVDKIVVSAGEFMDNVIAGVESFRADRPILLATGDLPTLTPEAVEDFVDRSLSRDAEFAYPLVAKETMIEQFPGSERTFFRLTTGEYTGGNVALIAPELALRSRELGQRLFELRKSPVSTVKVLGMRFALRLMIGRLDAADVERKASEIIGARGIAVFTPYGCIGADVDKPVDVVVAERVLYERLRGRGGAGGVE